MQLAWFLAGLRRFAPLAVPLVVSGISFGVLATQAGVDPLATVVFSSTTFAAGAQFAAVQAWHGGGLLAAVLVAALLNGRYLGMGLTLAPALPQHPVKRALSGSLLVDESWLLSQIQKSGAHRFFVYCGVAAAEYFCWVAGTIIGVLSAGVLPKAETLGLDMALTAVFLWLLQGQLTTKEKKQAAAAGAAVAALCAAVGLGTLALLLAPVPALIVNAAQKQKQGVA